MNSPYQPGLGQSEADLNVDTGQDRRILVGDQDRVSRSLLISWVTAWGYEVESASDGPKALSRLIDPAGPSLALVDALMFGSEGPALCRHLRSKSCSVAPYLILMTSKHEPEEIERALEAGADDFIGKPCYARELRARLRMGHRILSLQVQIRQQNRLQGVLQQAGTACHDLNQPLQAVLCATDLLLMDEQVSNREALTDIRSGARVLGQITRKIMGVVHATRSMSGTAPKRTQSQTPLVVAHPD